MSVAPEDASPGIALRLDVMLARRKVKSKDLAEHIQITEANLSLLKQGKVKGIRFDTLAAICRYLRCQPGDLLELEDAAEMALRGLASA
ncbi:MAG: Cro/Cl family transcriptional regulator [Caulobacteraceae bacterium]|nr:Cro/Cl family transcriptional regulator [Caulobacteraceae bacterium]